MLCVFSMAIAPVGAECALTGLTRRRTSLQRRMPSAVGTARTTQPENHATIDSS